jgi:hypothetical protein
MRKSLLLGVVSALIVGGTLTGSAVAGSRADRSDRGELTANQIVAQSDARVARMKADLRLTPEQEKNWSGFNSAMSDVGKRNADREIALRATRVDQKSPPDFIENMRHDAASLSERSEDEKKLADAAQPLYGSLDARQKERFSRELMSAGSERMRN